MRTKLEREEHGSGATYVE